MVIRIYRNSRGFVFLISVIISAYVLTDLLVRKLTVSFGAIVVAVCAVVALLIDINTGSYECPKCKKTFVPDLKTYLIGLQIITKRKMTCPHCGERNWCKRILNK